MESNSEKIPPSALSLYVKLFCKKKGSKDTKYRNNLIEATKSWVSLSDQEKQQFYNKLDECKTQYRKQFADYLKNAKPYLKRKPHRRVSNHGEDHQDASTEVANKSVTEAAAESTETNKSNWEQHIEQSQNEEQIDKEGLPQNEDSMGSTRFPTLELPPEPAPPNVKTSEDLFKVVQAMEGQNDRTWKSLTKPEKNRYQNALLMLKKNYIMKYKTYLENLPSKELFDHYNKQVVN